jgi:hypothetical protein
MPQPQFICVFRIADTSSYSIEERLVTAALAVAHRHLRHHCHGHHVVLTLPHQTIRCGVLSRKEWPRVTTTTTKICAELWKDAFRTITPKNAPAYVTKDMEAHNIKVHIRIHWTCNQGVLKWFKSSYVSVLVGVRWLLAHSVYLLACIETLW